MPKSAERCKKRAKSTTTEKFLKVQPYKCWPNNVQSRPKIHTEPRVIDLAKQINKKILFKKNINSQHHFFCEQLKNYKRCQKARKVAIKLHKKTKK